MRAQQIFSAVYKKGLKNFNRNIIGILIKLEKYIDLFTANVLGIISPNTNIINVITMTSRNNKFSLGIFVNFLVRTLIV